jgi:hypothetical protein
MSLPISILRMTACQNCQSIRKRVTSNWISSSIICLPSSVPGAKLLYFSQMYQQTWSRTKSDNKHDTPSLRKRDSLNHADCIFHSNSVIYYLHPPSLFVVWHVEKTQLIVNKHTSLWGDGEGYRNKRFNLPGPSWITVCLWFHLGNLSNCRSVTQLEESEWLTILPFLVISDPSSATVLSPPGHMLVPWGSWYAGLFLRNL